MRLIQLALLSCLSFGLSAQISITSADIQFPVTPDTAFGRIGQFLGVTLPTEGTNQTWNYANMVVSIPVDFSLELPDTNANFPQAQGMVVSEGFLAGLTIEDIKTYYHYDANGIYYTGYQLKQKTYDMNAITGGVEDELTVVGSHTNYGSSVVQYPFPMTYQTTWHNNYRETIPMVFDILGFGNPGDSVEIILDYIGDYEIVGWGTVTMPANLGTHEALLLKYYGISIDSVYLNGMPAPPAFVAGSGLGQGDTTIAAYYEIMIRGINRSAIQFNTDETHSMIQTINFCSAPSVFGVEEKELLAVNVYPNPTATGQVSISFNKPNSGKWQLKAYAITGELVNIWDVDEPSGPCSFNFDLPETKGIYLMSLEDDRGVIKMVRRVTKN